MWKLIKKIMTPETTWQVVVFYAFVVSLVMMLAGFSLYFTDKQ